VSKAQDWPVLDLPVKPPFAAMEAELARALPRGDGWQYEPKWDGFRCLAYKDGSTVALQSKAGQSLGRYFPELVAAVRSLEPRRLVVDGEIVVPRDGLFSDFDLLLQRIHPAESRVKKLAAETPVLLHAFDLLVDARGVSLVKEPLSERRKKLEQLANYLFDPKGTLRLSPATRSRDEAVKWEGELRGKGIDGIIAKRVESPYLVGSRDGAKKVKFLRTCDVVVGGFRYGSKERIIGSLLLGLHDEHGRLHHVGFCSAISHKERRALTPKLEALKGDGFSGSAPGGPSRWSTARTMEWEGVKPVLVVEISFDHFDGNRFRHGTGFVRWRPDKAPEQCTFAQLRAELARPAHEDAPPSPEG
jgi:ATP-dependent DNA ligase